MNGMYEIFERVALGPLEAKNRIVRSATWLGLAGDDGAVTGALLERYAELATGGAGILVTGYAFVSTEGRQMPRMLGVDDDALVLGLTHLARTMREGGALAGVQLVHAGGQTQTAWTGGRNPVAPSFVEHPQYPEVPRELTQEQIARIAGDFGKAARRARDAGFDFVQIHAAHGYLISQFLSPATNLRTDGYGGGIRTRFRFLQEVVAAVQGAAGADFPVAVKLNGCDFIQGGFELEDAVKVAEWLAMRAVCFIEVSGGTPASGDRAPARTGIRAGQNEAYFEAQAAAIKRSVPCPVALVGGVRSVTVMEDLLLSGVADLFSLSRPLIWEPDLPRRWESGDREPAKCISCNGCFEPARSGRGALCVVQEKQTAGGTG
jgi:2,4-dienoyl-CoA reductase-like NADH-dependent reductase (Old Yellow Enzyme family)